MSMRIVAAPLLIMLSSTLVAGTDLVLLPENYNSTFVRYTSIDKPAGERPAKMRFFYVNPESLTAAKAGEPLPSGTVLIMEDHAIELNDADEPILDSNGRFIPTAQVTNIFVQEKRDGWGEEYAETMRNGEWEYAWFDAEGSRKTDAKMDGCFTCHLGTASTDYNFTFSKFIDSFK